MEKDTDLYRLDTWFHIYSHTSPDKISCKLYLPNPQYLGLEKSLELCEFIEYELLNLLKSKINYPDLLIHAIENSLFIVKDSIDKIK